MRNSSTEDVHDRLARWLKDAPEPYSRNMRPADIIERSLSDERATKPAGPFSFLQKLARRAVKS